MSLFPFLKKRMQVRGVDQTPYQSWHSPLRWATSYAHEVAPCFKMDLDLETAFEIDKASRCEITKT